MESVNCITPYKQISKDQYNFEYYKISDNTNWVDEIHFQYPTEEHFIGASFFKLRYFCYIKKIKLILYTTKNYIPWGSVYADEIIAVNTKDIWPIHDASSKFLVKRKFLKFYPEKNIYMSTKMIANIMVKLKKNGINFFSNNGKSMRPNNQQDILDATNWCLNRPILYNKEIVKIFFANLDYFKKFFYDKIFIISSGSDKFKPLFKQMFLYNQNNSNLFLNIENNEKAFEQDPFGYGCRKAIFDIFLDKMTRDGLLTFQCLASKFLKMSFISISGVYCCLPMISDACSILNVEVPSICNKTTITFIKSYNKEKYNVDVKCIPYVWGNNSKSEIANIFLSITEKPEFIIELVDLHNKFKENIS